MPRPARPYWGSPCYKKPKRTSNTFSRSSGSGRHNPKRYNHDRNDSPPKNRSSSRAKIPDDDGRERVKMCLSCEHFSADHTNCDQCGLKLRENAKLFLNPLDVRAVFKDIIASVTNMGPDFLPMPVKQDDTPHDKSGRMSITAATVADSSLCRKVASNEQVMEVHEDIKEDTITAENIITISSDDDESENESLAEFGIEADGIEEQANDSPASNINDEDTSDLIIRMQNAKCAPSTNYFVKKCERCQTYSFDLQKCETCGKRISPRMEIVLYQSISKRKLKQDEWRKAKYHVIRHEKHKIPIPVQRCDMDLVNKIKAKRKATRSEGATETKVPKKSRKRQQASGSGNRAHEVGNDSSPPCTIKKRQIKRIIKKSAKSKKSKLNLELHHESPEKSRYERFKQKVKPMRLK